MIYSKKRAFYFFYIFVKKEIEHSLMSNHVEEELSDSALVEKILSTKDERFFAILYDRYASFVYNQSYAFINSEEEAQDLTHDIFIKIYLNLKTFKKQSKLSTWIYSITYHHCLNYVKKNQKNPEENKDLYEDINNLEQTEEEISDSELFEINYAKLQEILNKIDLEDKAILLMKYKDDMSIKDISELLEIKESAVKMRLQRAKKRVLELR